MRIAVVGLGKLGAPLAAVLAAHGHDVTGIDLSAEAVNSVNAGRSPIDEPGLADLIGRHRSRLRATSDIAAVREADATFVVVPTPSVASGRFSNAGVIAAVEGAGAALRGAASPHVLTVTSTVLPGSMDREIRPALERAAGRSVGEGLGLCYNPLFIALGSVVRDLMEPDLVLIGESDPAAGAMVESVHRSFVTDRSAIRRMSYSNAEIAKLAVNTFVTTKISYANMLAEICERLPGGDVDVVTSAIGLDRRIGSRYLKGGLGYGGPCFPRDNSALAAVAAEAGVEAAIAVATDTINRHQLARLARLVRACTTPDHPRAGVLGLSYKPDTHVVDESPGVMLANQLAADGVPVAVFDPAAAGSAATVLARSVTIAPSLAACLERSDVVAVTVPWPAFKQIPQLLAGAPRRPFVLIDCWRLFDQASLDGLAELVHIGRSRTPSAAGQR